MNPSHHHWSQLIRSFAFSVNDMLLLHETGKLQSFFSNEIPLTSLATSQQQHDKLQSLLLRDNAIEKDKHWLSREHHFLVTCLDDTYPALLKHIPDPPIALFAQGDIHLLKTPQLAIVGSRTPSATGQETAYQFSHHMATLGFTITSGLALGIDGAAHEGALTATGKTIAVCGTGLDRVYPSQHGKLAHRIAEQGLMISEFPTGFPPKPEHFPLRNRIISGLSLGTLVVEAALKSGSLITARIAAEQGREVFAIPGSLHNPLARGCHQLIRQGAKLVENTDDILEELGALAHATMTTQPAQITLPIIENPSPTPILSTEEKILLRHFSMETTSLELLIVRTGFRIEVVSSMLLMLELRGFVKSVAGGYIKTL
jgi:DNA processing protein